MKKFLSAFLIFTLFVLSFGIIFAQSGMEEAESRIALEKTERRGSIDLSGLELNELPESLWELTHLSELFIYGNQLTTISPRIAELSHLRYIQASVNRFEEFPTALLELNSLQELLLYDNQIASIPPEIARLQSLRTLQMGNNQLTDLPLEITQLHLLILGDKNYQTGLILYGNPLPADLMAGYDMGIRELFILMSPELANEPKFDQSYLSERLNLQEILRNGANDTRYFELQLYTRLLPPELWQLTELTSLTINNQSLTELPAEIAQLQNLRILDLRGNQLTSLPPEIGQLRNLEELILELNQLSSLPPEIGNLTMLRIIALGNNQLSSLPSEIGNLSNLEELFLNNNQLSSLNIDFSNMSKLHSLSLANNLFTEVPVSLATASSLLTSCPDVPCSSGFPFAGYFTISSPSLQWPPAEFASLPEEDIMLSVFISLDPALADSLGAVNLIEMSLPPAFIEVQEGKRTDLLLENVNQIPPALFTLRNLEDLTITGDFTSLPPEIGNLTNLRRLTINFSQLTSLPPEIANLSNLRYLQVTNSPLSELPPEIGNLSNLEELILYSNQLQSLPDEIRNLSKLYSLDLSSNPISELPLGITQLYGLLMNCGIGQTGCMGGLAINGTNISDTILLNQGLEAYNTAIRSDFANDYAYYIAVQNPDYLDMLEQIAAVGGSTTLYLDMGDVGIVPNEIGELIQLEDLTLVTNASLTALPDSFVNLQNLRRLSIRSYMGSFSAIPSEIYALRALEKLELVTSSLANIDGISNLIALQELHLFGTNLLELPSEIGQLANLRYLSVVDSPITSLPDSIVQLSSLEELILNMNQLRSLPTNFGNFPNLVSLQLQDNYLTAMPSDFSGATMLTSIDLRGNQLENFPMSILSAPSLCQIVITENPINILPIGLLWHSDSKCAGRLYLWIENQNILLPSTQALGTNVNFITMMSVLQYSFIGTIMLGLILFFLWMKNRH